MRAQWDISKHDFATMLLGIPIAIVIAILANMYAIRPLGSLVSLEKSTTDSITALLLVLEVFFSRRESAEAEDIVEQELSRELSGEMHAPLSQKDAQSKLSLLIRRIQLKIQGKDWDDAWAECQEAEDILIHSDVRDKSIHQKIYELKQRIDEERSKEEKIVSDSHAR